MTEKNPIDRVMGGSAAPTLLKLALACVAVGVVLSLFQIDPTLLWRDFFGAVRQAWERFWSLGWDTLSWALRYLALGAVIVIPVWLIYRLARAVLGRRDAA